MATLSTKPALVKVNKLITSTNLRFISNFIMHCIAGAPGRQGQAGRERAHFVRLQVRHLDRNQVPGNVHTNLINNNSNHLIN